MYKIYNEDCLFTMDLIIDSTIDLTITSPPYDSLRKYNGYAFNFENVARQIYRITCSGGVLIWVVSDATVKGSETGTSFKQALFFMRLGFNLHDTMIWDKVNTFGTAGNPPLRYAQNFEYIFVFSKGKPKTINLQRIDCAHPNTAYTGRTRRNRMGGGSDEKLRDTSGSFVGPTKVKSNIHPYPVGFNHSTRDKIAFEHPAIFPEKLAEDQILTWSNENDLIYDPFTGSGTTGKMALLNNRNFIGSEISEEYCRIAEKRISDILI